MKFIFWSLFILFSIESNAHQDMIISKNKENVHLQYLSGYEQYEIGHKIDILLELSSKLFKIKKYNSEKLFIFFDHDYTKRDSAYYTLSYGQFRFKYYDCYNTQKTHIPTGVNLIIRDRDFDIRKILNIINNALSNVDYIKANQKQVIIDLHRWINGEPQYDTLFSISSNIVKKYMSSSDIVIRNLLNEKTYRTLTKLEDRDIDYYYQNNKFHFYDTREPDEEWSENEQKYIISKRYGEDILIVDNVHEISGSFYDGHFIFINDSVFYYIPLPKDKVGGPYKIDSVRAGRPPIFRYYHEYDPERFTLYISNYQSIKKALFFPDSNVVFSNFEKSERELIDNLFHNTNIRKESRLMQNIILTMFVLSFILNIWFLFRKK